MKKILLKKSKNLKDKCYTCKNNITDLYQIAFKRFCGLDCFYNWEKKKK